MNNLKWICLLTATVLSLVFFSSCKDDDCTANLDCAGVCGGTAVEDCEGTCNGAVTMGMPCDDNDPDTTNDIYDANCNCIGIETCETLSATFDGEVLNILEATCAYEGCHPNYLEYATIKEKTDSGAFQARVLDRDTSAGRPMPPPDVPDDKPKNLTTEQLQILTCWMEAGYPEN